MLFWWILDPLSKQTLYGLFGLASALAIVSGMIFVSSRSHKFDTISKVSALVLLGSLGVLPWILEFLLNHI